MLSNVKKHVQIISNSNQKKRQKIQKPQKEKKQNFKKNRKKIQTYINLH